MLGVDLDQDMQRHAVHHQRVSDCPLVEGNALTLLPSGAAALSAMFDAIAAARDFIHLEYYIFEDVQLQGRRLSTLLAEAMGRGVEVTLIYDGVGSLHTPDAVIEGLERAGARTLEFHPLNPLRRHFNWHFNDRDHRKILVVDGVVTFLGGVNLSRTYENPPEAGAAGSTRMAFWYDCAVRIEGPATGSARRLFLQTWREQGGAEAASANTLLDRNEFPVRNSSGGGEGCSGDGGGGGAHAVRIAGSAPSERRQLYFDALREAIAAAASHIMIATGYFVPARRDWQALADASRRGVRVDLVLPGYSDVRGALHAGRALYGRLLAAGVRVHEMHDGLLHAKAATIDGVWTAIGSSNFDRRSFSFNNEVDAVTLNRETAAAVEGLLGDWMGRAREVTLEAWRRRSVHEHVGELAARVWERYM